MLLPLLPADCEQQVRDTAHLFNAPVRYMHDWCDTLKLDHVSRGARWRSRSQQEQLAASSSHHHWAPETAGHNSGMLRTCLLVDGSTRL